MAAVPAQGSGDGSAFILDGGDGFGGEPVREVAAEGQAQVIGQMQGFNGTVAAQNQGMFEDIFHFAHIARIVVVEQKWKISSNMP